MDHETFTKHLEEALDELPQEFRDKLTNVEIMVRDEPNEEQRELLKLRPLDRLFGLYTGVPQTVAGEDHAVMPDRITVFRLPILEAHDSEEEIIKQIRSTLYHEIGHFFGMDEHTLRNIQNTQKTQ